MCVIVSSSAFADDTPVRMYQPEKPEMVGYPNWVLTPDGEQRLQERLASDFREIVRLKTENGELKTTLVEWEAKPALTWKGAAILLGIGVLVGAGVAATIAVAAR